MATEYKLTKSDHDMLASTLAEYMTHGLDVNEYIQFYCDMEELEYDTVKALADRDLIDTIQFEFYYHDYHYETYLDEYSSDELVGLAIECGVINSLEEYLAECQDEDTP